jgi:hypothetical protein
VALLLVTIVGLGVLNILIPRPLGGLEGAPINPTGIPGAEDRLDPYITGGLLYLLWFMLAALLALRVRYEQAQAVERQQLKWFLYGAVALLITTGGTAFGYSAPTWCRWCWWASGSSPPASPSPSCAITCTTLTR